jgi:pimeloyl-ACP methyl ester carboxylesterase
MTKSMTKSLLKPMAASVSRTLRIGVRVCAALAVLVPWAHGSPTQTTHDGLVLNANYHVPTSARERIFLVVHGTWAHSGMEIVASLQGLLGERGAASLAPTLSLGQSDRSGFLPCAPEMLANHAAALAEIDHWVGFLQRQGWRSVVIIGHSRGGAQAAWYQASVRNRLVEELVLLAPMVWRESEVAAAYDAVSKVPLAEVLKDARGSNEQRIGPYRLLGCDDVLAPPSAFLSYYGASVPKHTPAILRDVAVPVSVLLGTADRITQWSDAERQSLAAKTNVRIIDVDGAGHFFRDLYLDDVVDQVME